MMMRIAGALLLVAVSGAGAGDWDCVEILRFEVDRQDFSTREMERASATPDEFLESVQRAMAGEIVRGDSGLSAVMAGEDACPNDASALEFGGQVTDFKPGSRLARYVVGFGAGKQKLQVQAWLRAKATGEVLTEGRIVDRKVAGFGGGSGDKGIRDFAEKVDKFIGKALGRRK